ncbi:MAG: phosphoribosylformylglycinamidine cyclo-ligase [Gemmatimonadetes bacterium]|nr:phosphoribosylformylglycinamidine cyclo-ligase [Gemmatimonadota bacterium]
MAWEITTADRYRESGVDLDAAERAKSKIGAVLAATRSGLARGSVGGFGGMVKLPEDVPDPVLVMSTDGVGTKLLVAIRAGRHDTVGEDLVNHCVNDILAHGARPVAFQDYIATAAIDPDTVAALVEGVARGCRGHDMTLSGGETAEMPDLYHAGHYDLAGTIIGVVSEADALHGDRVAVGDVLIGYESSGLHTNGYSLARRIVFEEQGLEIGDVIAGLGVTVEDALLSIHRSYYGALAPVLDRVHALAHITGGGLPGNLSRSLPPGCGAVIESASWSVPPLFTFLAEAGQVERDEMFRVFNMGVGLIAIVPGGAVDAVRAAAAAVGVPTWTMGEVVEDEGVRIE